MPVAARRASGCHVARWPTLSRGLEVCLWVLAASLLGSAAWIVGDAHRYQRRAAGRLSSSVSWGESIPAGTPIARLSIPGHGVSVVVAEGVSPSVLRRAVGHVPTSARPGEAGNVVLAGHRDTFLRRLEQIRAGDTIVLDSVAGPQHYRVEWTTVVGPEAVELIADTGYAALTLVTCYPFRYVGPAPQRFVARARLDEPLGSSRRATARPPQVQGHGPVASTERGPAVAFPAAPVIGPRAPTTRYPWRAPGAGISPGTGPVEVAGSA